MNKRGLVISKDSIIGFDENKDHDFNLGRIILENYSQYKDEIDIINGVPRVMVFKGCAIITLEDDVVILNAFDENLLIFLPEDIRVMTEFQKNSLTDILNDEGLDMDMTIEGLPKDPFNSNISYSKQTLLDSLVNSKKRR